jgi:hypothetical protein
MVTPDQVKWGSYRQFSGAYFVGNAPYTLPTNPSEAAKVMAVVTSAEGGHFDSVNAYDRCILTVGLLQFCEAGQYSASDLFGALATTSPFLLDPLKPALAQAKARFDRNEKGRYRFFFLDSRGEVDTLQEQHQLFQLHSDGTTENWDDESKAYVKQWVACAANTLAQPDSYVPQIEFTANRLMNFVSSSARTALWDGQDNAGWVGATRAAYTSFAVNSPAAASAQLQVCLGKTSSAKWSPDWCTEVLQTITFGSGIAIWPRRYNVIRPTLENLYKIDLPDFAQQLQDWHATHGIDPTGPAPTFTDLKDVQRELIAEGFDLGPAQDDGRDGTKTREAVMTFQRLHGLSVTGSITPETRQALVVEWRKRNG